MRLLADLHIAPRTVMPKVVAQVEQIVTDVIELADSDALDLLPSQAVVQEVLDTLDERRAGSQKGREGTVL